MAYRADSLDSPFALALREPNLLVPLRAPIGQVKVDWTNPLTENLQGAILPDRKLNLVSGKIGYITGTELELAPFDRYGVGIKVPASSSVANKLQFENPNPFYVTTGAQSVVAIINYTGPNTTSGPPTITSSRNGNGGLNFDINNGNLRLVRPGTAVLYQSSLSLTLGETCVVGFSHEPSVYSSLFLNGVEDNDSTPSSITFISDTQCSIGGGGNADQTMRGWIGLVLVWDRLLTAGEHRLLAENPLRILRPANDAPYLFSVGGGGAGVTITASTGSFTLTGNAAGLEAGRKLTAEAQSYTLTGQDATLKQGFSLLAEQGTITYTGIAAGLTTGRKLAADQQTYTLTGIDAGLTYTPAGSYDLIADAASYTLTGQATGLLAGRTLAAEAAAYTLTGVDAGLTYTPTGAYSLTADAATFALTGVAADLVAARKLAAAAETYTLTGIAVGLSSGYGMSAGIGSYALTGVEVAFGRTYQVAAGVGTYSLAGIDAGLDYSGQSAWTEIPAASTTWTPISEAATTWTEID